MARYGSVAYVYALWVNPRVYFCGEYLLLKVGLTIHPTSRVSTHRKDAKRIGVIVGDRALEREVLSSLVAHFGEPVIGHETFMVPVAQKEEAEDIFRSVMRGGKEWREAA